MRAINSGTNLKIRWKILREVNKTAESFSQNDNIRMFLIGSGNVYGFTPIIGEGHILTVEITGGTLSAGGYDVKLLWEKNGGRSVQTSLRTSVFGITNNSTEAPMSSVPEEIYIVSYVESIGRDGMSAYETAVLRGLHGSVVSEVEWVRQEAVRQANEQVRKTNEEERQKGETDRWINYYAAEGTLGGASAEKSDRWSKYIEKEAERDLKYNEAEKNRNNRYALAEGLLSDIPSANTRWGYYKNAENLRTQAYEDAEAAREVKYSTAETARDNEYDSAEATREVRYVIAEGKRDGLYSVAESDRETRFSSAEYEREKGETSRADAEAARVSKEAERRESETARRSAEDIRVSQENARKNSETRRESAEAVRVSQEDIRSSNENARKSAENARVSQENTRKSSESDRVQNEDSRKNAEAGRVANEAIRQGAEAAREEAFRVAEDERDAHLRDVIGAFIPTGIKVDCPELITKGNLIPRGIAVEMQPEGAMKNVMYLSDNRSVMVWPDGRLEVTGKGKSVVHVVPTMNTALARSFVVDVVEPGMRMTQRKGVRLLSGGGLRLT